VLVPVVLSPGASRGGPPFRCAGPSRDRVPRRGGARPRGLGWRRDRQPGRPDVRHRRQRMAELRSLSRRGRGPHRRDPGGAGAAADPGDGMTPAATLVLAGSRTAAPESPSAETVLLGLPLVRRTALAASRAGFDRVYVLDRPGGAGSRA